MMYETFDRNLNLPYEYFVESNMHKQKIIAYSFTMTELRMATEIFVTNTKDSEEKIQNASFCWEIHS